MRHLKRGGNPILGGHKQLIAISGVAAVTSLVGIYLVGPPTSEPLPTPKLQATSFSLLPQAQLSNGVAPLTEDQTVSPQSTEIHSQDSKLIINDQEIILPKQGSLHKSLSTDNGQTTVDISIDNGSTRFTGSSSMNLNISSQTSSYSESVEYDEHSPPL